MDGLDRGTLRPARALLVSQVSCRWAAGGNFRQETILFHRFAACQGQPRRRQDEARVVEKRQILDLRIEATFLIVRTRDFAGVARVAALDQPAEIACCDPHRQQPRNFHGKLPQQQVEVAT